MLSLQQFVKKYHLNAPNSKEILAVHLWICLSPDFRMEACLAICSLMGPKKLTYFFFLILQMRMMISSSLHVELIPGLYNLSFLWTENSHFKVVCLLIFFYLLISLLCNKSVYTNHFLSCYLLPHLDLEDIST